MEQSKHMLSSLINQQQRDLNLANWEEHRIRGKAHMSDNPSRNSSLGLNRSLAGIQLEQMQLRKMGATEDLIKSRLQDQEDLATHRQKFPYGKENV